MLEKDVEKTLIGNALEIVSPFYPYQGKINPSQTEYLFGEDGFPQVFVFCCEGVVIHVDDHRSRSRPDAPYVGMPEEWIHCTELVPMTETTHSTFHAGGKLNIFRHYVSRDSDYVYFSVEVHNGYVAEVKDYRDDPSPRLHGTISSSGTGSWDNPEDFWYDSMDEFEDYDEAAEYWAEEYGGDSIF